MYHISCFKSTVNLTQKLLIKKLTWARVISKNILSIVGENKHYKRSINFQCKKVQKYHWIADSKEYYLNFNGNNLECWNRKKFDLSKKYKIEISYYVCRKMFIHLCVHVYLKEYLTPVPVSGKTYIFLQIHYAVFVI